jgi:hypothetical protein
VCGPLHARKLVAVAPFFVQDVGNAALLMCRREKCT